MRDSSANDSPLTLDSEQFDDYFGARVKEAREARNMSQRLLVELLNSKAGLNWHQTTLAKTEQGARPVRYFEAMAIAQALFTTPDELLLGTDYRRAQDLLRATDIQRDEMRHLEHYVLQRRHQIDKVVEAQSQIEFDLRQAPEPDQ